MVGAIPGHIRMHDKPVGRGYVILEPNADHPWRSADQARSSMPLRAHEFHYSNLYDLPADTRYAYAVQRGHGIDGHHDGVLIHRLLASYTHLRATIGCDWPAKFVRHIRDCMNPITRNPPSCSH